MATVQVMEVQKVELTVYKTYPATLGISADGVVPTPGFTNPQLVPWVYIMPPQDGIWDFDFVADEPKGPVQQVLSPISASYFWHSYPQDLKGVRIHARMNSVEALLEEGREKEVSTLQEERKRKAQLAN
jgi:hypothetical protein